MSQLSFFSAESVPPAVADLTGVLAAAGQVVMVGGGARLSVVVEELWRARALAEMMTEAGLDAEITRTEEDTPLVRTAVDVRLVGIATDWTRGAVKTVPPQWLPGPARAEGLDAGRRRARGRPLPPGSGSARPRHAFTAGVGADAGGNRTDADRHQGLPAGVANQWPQDGYRAW